MRKTFQTLILLIIFLVFACYLHADPLDYSRLIRIMPSEEPKAQLPLLVFSSFTKLFDNIDTHKNNLTYFDDHPELIKKIQEDLDSNQLKWKLDNSSQRLLFVPEKESEYVKLYEKYCIQAIDYILGKMGMKNPYDKIEVLRQEKPKIKDKGVTAYLVHNLVKEVVSTYVFSNPANQSLRLKIENKTYLGEVGSYSTHLEFQENNDFSFIPNNYTIWQTSAKNPFTALSVPVEETLHIILRDYTHQAIKQEILKKRGQATTAEIKKIIEDWIAVEEALIGGLIHNFLPSFLKSNTRGTPLPDNFYIEDLQTRKQFEQYMYLERGVAAVEKIGFEKALNLYQKNPSRLKELLAWDMAKKTGEDDLPSPVYDIKRPLLSFLHH